MTEDKIQPPRYTSTPLAGRKSSNLLNNFIEVSPIFSTPERIKKAKSMIPVLAVNEIRNRSNGKRAVNKEGNLGTPKNSTDAGSCGLVKIPKTNRNLEAEKKNNNVQAICTKSNLKTRASEEVPKEVNPKNSLEDKAPAKGLTKTKQKVPGAGSTATSVGPATKATRTVPAKETRNSVDDEVPQPKEIKTTRISKISQRPSVLPSVPEDAVIEGAGEPAEDCIFKRSEIHSGWLIPKETKTRVSLKRKSSVPNTITKRNKKTVIIPSNDEESLFDSPEMPNLEEISSLGNKRKTYVVKDKLEISDIHEESHESVTNGIVPLDDPTPKSPSNNVKVVKKNVNENSTNEGCCKEIALKNDEKCKKSVPKRNNVEKESKEESVSPNVTEHQNKTKPKQSEGQLKECVDTESTNSKSKLSVKSITPSTKLMESNTDMGQEISKQSIKEVKTRKTQKLKESKETIKKTENYKNTDTDLCYDPKTQTSKSNNRPRRTLRERKQNPLYLDTSEVDDVLKGTGSRKKVIPALKQSQEQNENSSEPLVEKQSQRNNKGQTNNLRSNNELVLQKGLDKANVNNCEEKVGSTGSKKTSNVDKCTTKNKKVTKIKKNSKQVDNENLEVFPVEEEKNEIKNAILGQEINIQNITSKDDTVISDNKINSKVKPTQQNIVTESTGKNNKQNPESRNVGALIQNDDLNSIRTSVSSLKSGKKTKAKVDKSPEAKRQKSVCKNSLAKHIDNDNPSFKTSENDASAVKPTKGKISSTVISALPLDNDNESPEIAIRQKTVCKNSLAKHEVNNENPLFKSAESGTNTVKPTISKQNSDKKEKNRKTIDSNRSKRQSKVKSKVSDAIKHSESDKLHRSYKDDNCPDSTSLPPSTASKRKSEEMEYGASQTEPAAKKHKPVDINAEEDSGIIDSGFSVKDLLGMRERKVQEHQPGVVTSSSIHINNFVMMGEVRFEPGASLTKISTNTSYSVREGTASVTINKKHTKLFNAGDTERQFFIPKNINVSITNPGNIPLKMEFVKFRG